jgi:hypothetical protein
LKIGLDLDNTIVNYVPAFSIVAKKLGLEIESQGIGFREALKSEGNEVWQLFQSMLYTEGLTFAEPAPGLFDFLRFSRAHLIDVSIVSHKTTHTPKRFGRKDLREPALRWLADFKIVPQLVDANRVRFCTTRAAKIRAIGESNFDWFVDDLEPVLDDRQFPTQTIGWKYSSVGSRAHGDTMQLDQHRFSTFSFPELLEILQSELNAC